MHSNTVQKHIFLLIFCFFSIVTLACTSARKKSFGYSEFGEDAEYFYGLKSIKAGDIDGARRHFSKAEKKGTSVIARKSVEALCTWGTVDAKEKSAAHLVSLYQDEDAVLLAARLYFDQNEFSKVISLTKEIDPVTCSNELERIRLDSIIAMSSTFSPSFLPEEELKIWFLSRPYSSDHYKFFTKLIESKYQFETPILKTLLEIRTWAYRRDYSTAIYWINENQLFEQEIDDELFTEQIISDLGKVYLYSSNDYVKNARLFQELSGKFESDGEKIFYCQFYAGRLYDKAVEYRLSAEKAFTAAFEATKRKDRKDNALWYLLKNGLRFSPEHSVLIFEKYADEITDPNYFDDFFDMLAPLLLSESRYEEIAKLCRIMDEKASLEAKSKFFYIYGRILEDKIYRPSKAQLKGMSLEDEIKYAFTRALDSGTDMYYRVMAAEKLELSEVEKISYFCKKMKNTVMAINPDFEILLNGYAFFGFPEMIYPEWQKNQMFTLSAETTKNICEFLANCATNDSSDDYKVQSLRIASRYVFNSGKTVTIPLLQLVYPKYFSGWVNKYCEKYNLPPEVMYALIRSESFFDADVKSSAGAKGLCQLMDATGSDIARRLKKMDYDLTDPETSIEFGSYYLNEMITRLEGNYLDAFYAYNAGITRVRKWKKAVPSYYRTDDLFLEVLPFTETREYGRKLVAASEMYRWVYNQ